MCTGLEILAAISAATSVAGGVQQVSSANRAAKKQRAAADDFARKQIEATQRQRETNKLAKDAVTKQQEEQAELKAISDKRTVELIEQQGNKQQDLEALTTEKADRRASTIGEILPAIDLAGSKFAPAVVGESISKNLEKSDERSNQQARARAAVEAFGDLVFQSDLDFSKRGTDIRTLGGVNDISTKIAEIAKGNASRQADINAGRVSNAAQEANNRAAAANAQAQQGSALGNLLFNVGATGLQFSLPRIPPKGPIPVPKPTVP